MPLTAGSLLLAALAAPHSPAAQTTPSPAAPPAAQTPAAAPSPAGVIRPQVVGTIAELMARVIYPTSDAILYITSRTPTNEAEWNELEGKALMLAESANLLMLPGHARDQKQWMADAKAMRDAGEAAFKAAKARNVDALADLNDAVYQSCLTCHKNYRPNYGRGR